MNISNDNKYRKPSAFETQMFDKLLAINFSGRDELKELIDGILVKSLDHEGSLKLYSPKAGRASVAKRIPVEASAKDIDGVLIHVLLHVVQGHPDELEIFKEDGSGIHQMPEVSKFDLIVY